VKRWGGLLGVAALECCAGLLTWGRIHRLAGCIGCELKEEAAWVAGSELPEGAGAAAGVAAAAKGEGQPRELGLLLLGAARTRPGGCEDGEGEDVMGFGESMLVRIRIWWRFRSSS